MGVTKKRIPYSLLMARRFFLALIAFTNVGSITPFTRVNFQQQAHTFKIPLRIRSNLCKGLKNDFWDLRAWVGLLVSHDEIQVARC